MFFSETATHYPVGPIDCEVKGSWFKETEILDFLKDPFVCGCPFTGSPTESFHFM